MQIFVPRLAKLVAEALQGLVSVPIPGAFGPPECRVFLDSEEGPFGRVLKRLAAAGLTEARLWLLGLFLVLLKLLVVLLRLLMLLGCCFRRTWT